MCKTRAESLGLEAVVQEEGAFTMDKDVCGLIVQYPATDGSIDSYKSIADAAHAANIKVGPLEGVGGERDYGLSFVQLRSLLLTEKGDACSAEMLPHHLWAQQMGRPTPYIHTHLQCMCSIFSREMTIRMVMYGVHLRLLTNLTYDLSEV